VRRLLARIYLRLIGWEAVGAKTARDKVVVVDAARATLLPEYTLEGTRGEGPLVQRRPADTERIGEILIGACAVAIE